MTIIKRLLLLLFTWTLITSSNAFSSSSIPKKISLENPPTKSYVEIYDPKTNVKVILLGCLHGSVSSANDVRFLMESEETDGVVLELCDARLGDFEREPVDEYTSDTFFQDIKDFWDLTRETGARKGPLAATATLLLGTMSLIQTNLSGFRAGLEFAVALDIAKGGKRPNKKCDVFLADRKIEETMERIANLPSITLEIIRKNVIHSEVKALTTALFGDGMLPKNSQVIMPKVMVRSKQAITDLARLSLPPIIISSFFILAIVFALTYPPLLEQLQMIDELAENNSDFIVETISTTDQVSLFDMMLHAISTLTTEACIIGTGFLFFTLPAMKAIISERDVYLANGIRDACENVSSSSDEEEPKRIVAVLGLLHVNGVSKKLLQSGLVPAENF